MEGIGKGKGKFRGNGLCDSGCSVAGSSGGQGGGSSGGGSRGNDSGVVGQSGSWLDRIEHVGWEPGEGIVIDGDRVVGDGNEKKMVRLVECTICKEAFVDHDTNPCVRAPCCKAIAHKACVEKWLRLESRCFVCPRTINTRKGRAAYFADKLSADDIATQSTQEIQRKIADPGDLKEEFQRAREKFLQEKRRSDDEAFGEFLAREISGGEGVADIMSQQEKALAEIRANLQASLAADETLARKLEEEEREREAAAALKVREELERSERAARELAEMFEREAAEEEKKEAAEVNAKAEKEYERGLESKGERERLDKRGERGSKVRRASSKGAQLPGDRVSCSSGGGNGVKRPERMAQGSGASPSNRARGSVDDAVGGAVKPKGAGSRQSDRRDRREGSSNSGHWRAGGRGRGGGGLKPGGGRSARSKRSEDDSDFDEEGEEEEEEDVDDEWVEEDERRVRSPCSSKRRRLSGNLGGRSNTSTCTSIASKSNRTSPGGKGGGVGNDAGEGADAEACAGADAGAGTGGRGEKELPLAGSPKRAARHPNPAGGRVGIAKSDGGEDGVDGGYHRPVSLDRAMDDAAPVDAVDAKDPPHDPLRRAANKSRVVRAAADAEGALAAGCQLEASDARRQGRGGKGATAASPRRTAAAPTVAGVPSNGFHGGGRRDSLSAVRGGRSPRDDTSAKHTSPAKRSMNVVMKGDAHKNAIDLSQAD